MVSERYTEERITLKETLCYKDEHSFPTERELKKIFNISNDLEDDMPFGLM